MNSKNDKLRLTPDQFNFDQSGRLVLDAAHLSEASDQSMSKPSALEEAGIKISIEF